jgi:creatinine amidohydrolase
MSVRTAELSWRAIEAARNNGAAVLVPMGSTEEHGPHNATGDYLVTDAIAERVATNTGDLMIPTNPYSYSEYFRAYPGTITVQAETLRLLVRDMLVSVLDQGFRHVIILNGHKGNEPVLQMLLREIRRERGVLIPVVATLGFGRTKELIQELYQGEPTGHGGDPMGSLQSYLNPGFVKLENAEEFGPQPFLGLEPDGLDGLRFNGQKVMMALNMEDVTPPSGSLSNPRLASAERGERLVQVAVDAISDFVRWFKTIDPTVAPMTPPRAR